MIMDTKLGGSTEKRQTVRGWYMGASNVVEYTPTPSLSLPSSLPSSHSQLQNQIPKRGEK